MGIYRGDIGRNPEIGAIKYFGPCKYVNDIPSTDENHKEDVIAVFKNDIMVWPTVSKYLFWGSKSGNFKNLMMNDSLYINKVEPKEQNIVIDVRSCTRFFDAKYSLKAKCGASWISINNNPCVISNSINDITILSDTNSQCNESTPDVSFTINISKNTSKFDRTATIVCTQLDDYHSMTPTGKFFDIVITQKADYPLKRSDDFKDSVAIWYTDDTFSYTTNSYGDENNGYADIDGGDFKTYFSIKMKVTMASGIVSYRNYGTEGNEMLSNSSVISSSPDKVTVKSIIKHSDGKFVALMNVVKNTYSNGSSKPTISISDIETYPDNIDYNGGKMTISWNNYAMVSSDPFVSTLSIVVSNNNIIGIAQLYQNGGNLRYKTDDPNNIVVIPDEAKSWISTVGAISVDNNKRYSQDMLITKQVGETKMYVENLSSNLDSLTIPYDTTSLEFAFDIYKRENMYDERIAKLTILSSGTSEVVQIRQNGKEDSYPTLVTDKELDSSKINIKEIVPENDDYYNSIFKGFSNIRYYRYSWRADVSVNTNPQQNLEKEIYVEKYDNPISEKEHYEYVYWKIMSGIANSKERHSILNISIPEYRCNYKEEFEQNGSELPETLKYYDDLNPSIKNISDNIIGTVEIDKYEHIYKGTIKVNENVDKDENNVAYVVPDNVYEDYVGYVDNMNNSNIYLRISGSPYYKGKNREVKYSISCDGLLSKMLTTTQKMTSTIKANENVPCIGLNEDFFALTDDSQGYINGKPQLLSAEIALYSIPIHIEENTTAAGIKKYIRMDDVSSTEYISSQSVTLPDFYGSLTSTINAGWSKFGLPISKTVKLVVKDVKTIECKWNNIPYSGDLHTHTKPQIDYKISIKDGINWISLPSSNTIKFLHNKTDIRRVGKIQADFYDNGMMFDNIILDIMQNPSQKTSQYRFSSNIDIIKWYEIDNTSTFSFSIFTYDMYDNKEMNVVENYDYDDILLTKYSSNDGIVKYAIRAKKKTTDVKKTILSLDQYDRENKNIVGHIDVNMYIPSYSLTVSVDKTKLTVNNNENTSVIIVNSIKKTIEDGNVKDVHVPFNIYCQTNDWLSISVDEMNVIVKCLSMNEGLVERSVMITIEQSISKVKEYVTISEESWRDPQYDSSRIDFYNSEYPVKRRFYSMVNGIQATPKIKFISGSDPNIISANIALDGDQWTLEMLPSKDVDGEIYQYGTYEIYNDYRTIGKNLIYVHAYIFSSTSESNEEIVWYASKNANEFYSVYYITSKEDGKDIEYSITKYSSNISIKRNGNTIMVACTDPNELNETIEAGYLTLNQKNSNREINVKILQMK